MEIIFSFHLGFFDKKKKPRKTFSCLCHAPQLMLTVTFSVQFYVLYCVSLFLS